MRTAIIVLLAAAASTCGGCLRNMDVPQDFVSLSRSDLGAYDVRAVSADGVMVGLRHQANSSGGTLAFWEEACTNELKNQGYTYLKTDDVKSDAGQTGKLFEFTVQQQGRTFAYLLAIYVGQREILLAEAGGPSEAVKKRREAIDKSLRSVR